MNPKILPGDEKKFRLGGRVEAAFRKAERGEELTEREVLILRWETAMSRRHACAPRVRVFHERGRKEDR